MDELNDGDGTDTVDMWQRVEVQARWGRHPTHPVIRW